MSNPIRQPLTALLLCAALVGCATSGPNHGPTPVLAEATRAQLGRVAVRGDFSTPFELHGVTRGKGTGAAEGAGRAMAGWMDAAASDSEPGSAVVGVILLPFVAAGGAVYGAAVANAADDVAAHVETVTGIAGAIPAKVRAGLARELASLGFVDAAIVAVDAQDADLAAAGYDSVVDLRVVEFRGDADGPKSNTRFVLAGHAEVASLHRHFAPTARRFTSSSDTRALRAWAEDDGRAFGAVADRLAAEFAAAVVDDLFRENGLGVAPISPVKGNGMRFAKVKTTRPEFQWRIEYPRTYGTARIASGAPVDPATLAGMDFDLHVYTEDGTPVESYARVRDTRLTPPTPLPACAKLYWRVQAHYASMGRAVRIDSPAYRFRTPCP